MKDYKLYKVGGIPVTSLPENGETEFLRNLLEKDCLPVQIITLNLDFLRIAYEDREFHELCCKADYVVPDGMGVIHLIKKKYGIRINRVTGNDLLTAALSLSFHKNIRFAFAGADIIVLNKLKIRIQKEYPSAEIVALISPDFYFEGDPEKNLKVIDQLVHSAPDILFLALGCARQEKWISAYKDIIGAKINIGIGGAFDYFAGVRKRAPVMLQKMGLEWFWRFMMEPLRLYKRYFLKDIPFIVSWRKYSL